MADRIERYGSWHRAISENISFSEVTGKNIVLQFLVDDGNESRSHRRNIFNADYGCVGVGCGFHKIYDLICVVDLAGVYEDKLETMQKARPEHAKAYKVTPESPPSKPRISEEFKPTRGNRPSADSGQIPYREKENYSPNVWPKKHPIRNDLNSDYDNPYKPPLRETMEPQRQGTFRDPQRTQTNWGKTAAFDLDEDDWLPGAIKFRERKHTRFEGNLRIQTIKRTYTMEDGSIEIVEDRLVEKM